jgi:hypothetical protein
MHIPTVGWRTTAKFRRRYAAVNNPIPHRSLLILHPSSLIPHLSSLIAHPSSLILFMPLGAMLNSTLLIGIKSVTQQPTGEWSPSFSYTGATPITCRLYDRAARSNINAFGQTLEVDAVALVPASVSLEPLVLGTADGERQQVQIDGVLYEVLAVRDLGHVGRVKEIELKRWT